MERAWEVFGREGEASSMMGWVVSAIPDNGARQGEVKVRAGKPSGTAGQALGWARQGRQTPNWEWKVPPPGGY